VPFDFGSHFQVGYQIKVERNHRFYSSIKKREGTQMPTTDGIAAALTAPLLEAVGFLEWESHWAVSGGSAFALNMYKCNFASLLFLFMAVYASNKPYMVYSSHSNMKHNDPFSLTAQNEKAYRQHMNPINANANVQPMLLANQLDADQLQAQAQEQVRQQELQQKQNIFFEQEQEEIRKNQEYIEVLKREQYLKQQTEQQQHQQHQQHQQQQQQQEQQEQQGRRLEMTGGQPVDEQEYMILGDRRKKTPYDTKNEEDNMNTMEEMNGDFQFDIKTLPPYPENYRPPFSGQRYQISYIILSSLLGIVIGDCAELEALRLIGARRVLVVDTIKPFAAALIGNVLLNEALYPAAFVGMLLTAVGVYIVLMASIEKIEKIKEKTRKGSTKRNEDMAVYQGNDDMSTGAYSSGEYSAVSDDSYGEDAEIISLRNEESNRVTMIGMHRRPLSRHDLGADVEELLGDDENIVMLLEDGGRGIIDKTICCNSDQRSRRRLSSGSSWSSRYSMGDISINSMGSLEDLNVDVTVAMDNFESNEEDFFFSDSAIAESSSEDRDYKYNEDLKEAVGPTVEISIPTQQKNRPLKSALKKTSRYNSPGKDNIACNEDDTDYIYVNVKNNMPTSEEVEPLLNVATESKPNKMKRRNSFNSAASGSASASGSMLSIDTECGPPPGLYDSDAKRESKTQRKVRLRTGYCLAAINVLLDSYAAYLTKKYGFEMSTWEINLCRLGFAGAIMTTLAIFLRIRDWKKKRRLRNSTSGLLSSTPVQSRKKTRSWYLFPKMPIHAWITVSFGVIFVTFFAPALANYSLFQIPLALSLSLCSVTPLYTLPLGIIMKGEKPTRRGYIGAGLSVLGVAILCIWGLDQENL
jgi:drug/metabolite transporter (DMT)-like permease